MKLNSSINKKNKSILKDIFVKYVFSKAYVRMFSFFIVCSTFAACCFNVKVGEVTKVLAESIKSGNNIGKKLGHFCVISITSITLTELNNFLFTGPVQHIYRLAAENCFSNYINMNITEFNKIGTGEIQVIIDRISKSISELVEVIFLNIIPIFFTLILTCKSVFKNLGSIYILIISVSILIYIFLTIKIVHWRTKIRDTYNKSQQKCSNILQDSLLNFETILSYKKEEYEAVKYNEYVSEVERECNRLWISLSILFLVNKLIFAFQLLSILLLGVFYNSSYKLKVENVVFILAINKTLYQSLGGLGFFYSRYTQAILNMNSIVKIQKTNLITEDKYRFDDCITFTNVKLVYNHKIIFDKLNFTIKKGDKIAVIGRNGSGKTSLLLMLMQFVEYEGTIQLDSTNIKNISNVSFRKLISYVSQNSVLFNETVNYNIKYLNENVKETDIEQVAIKLNVKDSIDRLENGLHTQVGDRGSKLSGGERQKMLMLRGMLKKSEILIFDEPTSAFDKNAEKTIISSIINDQSNLTVLISLHNLDLLCMFDKVFHIKNKSIEIIEKDNIRFLHKL